MSDDHDLCNFSTTCKTNNFISISFSFIFSHPLYFSYFIFFSPYFFKFIFFLSSSPLFLTTALFVLVSVIATGLPHSKKLGFLQTIVDKIKSKLNHVEREEEEAVQFEDFEIYQIVFRDPPLIMVEDSVEVAVEDMELDKERRLERLFEELDRFEESTAEEIEMKQGLEKVMVTSAVYGNDFDQVMVTSAVSTAESEMKQDFQQVKVTSAVSIAENEMKQDSEQVKVTSAVSGGDFEHVKVTSSVSGFFAGKSDSTAEIDMKRNLEKVTSAINGNDFVPVKVTSAVSTAEIEIKSDLEIVSGELQKSETVMMTSSFSPDNQLTGRSSFTEKSKSSRFDSSSSFGSYESTEDSTTAIEMNAQSDHEEFVNLLPVTSSVSGEDQLTSRRLNDSPAELVGKLHKLKPVTSSISVNLVNKTVNNILQVDSSSSFGSYGSMRKEKEWKRTLACKLFEERRSLEGGEEGMDSLWETYETDNSSRKSQFKLSNKNKIDKKSEFKYFDDGENEEDDDEKDEFMSNGQLCCLKALKLSTGKMNLGMGKPNLVKISKALKGFGWLHHVGSKHGKKK